MERASCESDAGSTRTKLSRRSLKKCGMGVTVDDTEGGYGLL